MVFSFLSVMEDNGNIEGDGNSTKHRSSAASQSVLQELPSSEHLGVLPSDAKYTRPESQGPGHLLCDKGPGNPYTH